MRLEVDHLSFNHPSDQLPLRTPPAIVSCEHGDFGPGMRLASARSDDAEGLYHARLSTFKMNTYAKTGEGVVMTERWELTVPRSTRAISFD